MTKLAYNILLKKYLLIDLGVLLLLIVIPIYDNPGDLSTIVKKAILYSGFITPVVSYFEIKKSNQLPFFNNLKGSLLSIYVILLVVKVFLSLSIALYV